MSEEKQKKTEAGQAKGRTTSLQAPLIIGIGASAGGLEALQQFFDYMPSHSGMSFEYAKACDLVRRAKALAERDA